MTTTAFAGAAVTQAGRALTWRNVSLFGHGLILTGAGLFTTAIVIAGADPSGLAFTIPILALGAGVAAAVRSFGRWAQALSALFGVAMLALIGPALPHATPDSFFDFLPAVAAVAGALVVIAAAGADLARRGDPAPAIRGAFRPAAIGTGVVLVVAGAVSAVATYAGQETLSTAERAGSTPVAMKDVRFAPKNIRATEGQEVRFAVKNDDPVIHDLKIDGVADKVVVKPGSEKLMVFTAPDAGTYELECTLHPNMKGTLEVVAAP